MSATNLEEKIFIDTELLTNIEEESQVIIHCCMNADEYANAARIWPSTFIIDNQSGKRCQLVFADGITMYPNWTYIEEIIPQAGGFEYRKINRNKSDVYHVEFSE